MADSLALLKVALAERYAIERELGRGGMATVYLASDLKHQRRVALKILHPELASTIGPSRFLQEIRVTSRLQHPHILPVFDSGDSAGQLWYTMPFVEGESLRQRLTREKQLPVTAALGVIQDVAAALAYAHGQGVIHRDIKPENILLRGEQAVVADFGIARAVDAAGGERLTETGLALGTPAYMSPEQATGQRDLDGRSDAYSLACVLYEMLAGEPPFTGLTSRAILARHSIDPVPPLRTVRPGVPAAIELAITKALAKVPADRYPSVAEFAAALVDLRADGGQDRALVRTRRVRWAKRGSLALILLFLLFLGLNGRGLWPRWLGANPPTRLQSLAVLPLSSQSGDSSLGDAMTEALTTALGRISVLRVISRSAVMKYKASTLPPPQVARELGVDAVLGGGIQRSGDKLRLDLRLISAESGHRLWAQQFDQEFSKRSSIGEAVSRNLVTRLNLSVTPLEDEKLHTLPTSDPEAYDAFLRGKIHLRNNRRDDSIAIDALQHAVARDPSFAAAYAYLAFAYGLRIFLVAPRDTATFEKGLVTVEKAIRLDPDLAEAHLARGFLLWTPPSHFAHEQAIREYKRALSLNPNLAEAHHWLGVVYWHIGLFGKAIEEFRETEAIDPGSRSAQSARSTVLTYQGLYEEGLRIRREVPREFNPPMWNYGVAWDLLHLGRNEEASTVIEDYLKTSPLDPGGLVTGVRAILHARNGDARRAEEDIRKAVALGEGYGHFHHTAYNIASAYALLRRPGPAVQWLRRAAEDGLPCYPLFEKDPNLNNLRQDPGFLALMTELKPQWERWSRTL